MNTNNMRVRLALFKVDFGESERSPMWVDLAGGRCCSAKPFDQPSDVMERLHQIGQPIPVELHAALKHWMR